MFDRTTKGEQPEKVVMGPDLVAELLLMTRNAHAYPHERDVYCPPPAVSLDETARKALARAEGENAILRQRIEALEREADQAEALHVEARSLREAPPAWISVQRETGLQPAPAKVLAFLRQKAGQALSYDRLYCATGETPAETGVDARSVVQVYVVKIRAKAADRIVSIPSFGYRLERGLPA